MKRGNISVYDGWSSNLKFFRWQ